MSPPNKDKQDTILKQFRQQLEQQDLLHEGDSIGTDDATLLRFLRARQFDLKDATTMWSNCQHWRKTVEGVGIDELYKQLDPFNYPERDKVFECWPLWFHKTDKKGRPLNIHHFGGINMPELYKHVSPEKFWQTIVVNAESLTREVLPASARAAGRQIDGTFVIVDLKGFGIGQFWQMKNLARDSFQISQDYFPETMAQLAIINAPSSFTTIWSFIKPWLAKETLAKIDILGSDFKDVLLSQIDAENLPESLGGTCTCQEAGGCKLSNAGPWMEGRKERREKWVRGERERIGLGMEGEDEADGEAQRKEEPAPEEREQKQQAESEEREEKVAKEQEPLPHVEEPHPEEKAKHVERAEQQTQQVEEAAQASEQETSQKEDDTDAEAAGVAGVVGTGAGADTYGKSTEVVDSHGSTERTATSPESSPESTSGPPTPSSDSSSFESARSEVSDGSAQSASSTVSNIRKKLKLPKVLLGKKKSHDQSVSEVHIEKKDSHEQSVSEVYEKHPETRQPQMGDFAQH